MHPQADTEQNFSAQIVPAIIPKAPWRISEVRPMPDYRIWVKFNDGTQGTVAMAGLIQSPSAGVFAVLRDESLFSQVALHYGAVTWPGELDIAPDAMYEAIRRDGEWQLS
ncbi:MAG: DUF2442 domain-containing protein [Geobacteraceae bacterium]|nr:DUF2442 domain-containing protein [Geobacteraceae bacterium]